MQMQKELRNIKWKAGRLQAVRDLPPNPWRGLYMIYPFTISAQGTSEPFPPLNPDHSICLIEINLFAFRTQPVTEAALTQIDRIFAYFKQQEYGLIVRFLYDLHGNGLQNEPQNIAVILEHIKQLSPLLTRYASCIFTLQGLLVGSWGEMHGSRHLGAQSMITLIQALDDASEGKLLHAVRCPSQWREIFRTYDPPLEERTFTGELRSRVGLFNDAILASDTDYGTYGQTERAKAPNYGTKMIRRDELIFQNRLCYGVPNGGELVRGEGSFALAETYRTFRMMHLSYLNVDFDPEALNRLRDADNIVRGKTWRGTSAFAYLVGHLGYRYQIDKVQVKRTINGVCVRILLKNTGFACCYFPLEAALLVRAADGTAVLQQPIDADTRHWQPGESTWISAELKTLPLQEQEYKLELQLTDQRSRKSVYLATAAKGGGVQRTLQLGTLRIRRR